MTFEIRCHSICQKELELYCCKHTHTYTETQTRTQTEKSMHCFTYHKVPTGGVIGNIDLLQSESLLNRLTTGMNF